MAYGEANRVERGRSVWRRRDVRVLYRLIRAGTQSRVQPLSVIYQSLLSRSPRQLRVSDSPCSPFVNLFYSRAVICMGDTHTPRKVQANVQL